MPALKPMPKQKRTPARPLGVYVARDGDGDLWVFSGKPALRKTGRDGGPLFAPMWFPNLQGRTLCHMPSENYPELAPERCRELVLA